MAAIIVGGEEAGGLSGREILVQTFGGNLINVQDTTGFYDPLQYPILFPQCYYFPSITSKCRLHYEIIEPKSIFTIVEDAPQ